jgi:hypothetical protein
MPISIADALKLKRFSTFKLVAGQWGLNNQIDKIGILDHEIVEAIKGEFGKGDFVITSFTPARNDITLLVKSIKGLIDSEVSGLAIKNIYFKELPDVIIKLANSKNFPIFIFDEYVYYEDVIAEVNEEIRLKDDHALLMTKIDILLKDNISKNMVRELALEINHSFRDNFIIAFCKENKYLNDKHISKIINLYNFKSEKIAYHSVIKYRDGILLVCSSPHCDPDLLNKELRRFVDALGIPSKDFTIGVSKEHSTLEDFSKGLNEAFHAVQSPTSGGSDYIYYSDIGIYQILLPFIDHDYMRNYSTQIIETLKAYDQKHHTQLFETALVYIKSDQNIKTTAKKLFQHDNTIRYRLKKIKEVLHMEHLQGSFYEQLSIAIKIHMLISH